MDDDLSFAFGVTFPGTTPTDVVKAAIKHAVHIVDKELFNPVRDYQPLSGKLHTESDTVIYPLFIFPHLSILVNDEQSLSEAIQLTKQYAAEQ